jgi:hypothetical protein
MGQTHSRRDESSYQSNIVTPPAPVDTIQDGIVTSEVQAAPNNKALLIVGVGIFIALLVLNLKKCESDQVKK